LPGVDRLARRPFLTRASVTNASYVAPDLRVEGRSDPVRLEVFYDAQTSGGLLISVPADRAEALLANLHGKGAAVACLIGEVAERGDKALIVRN
jgi:selenide,water dikinase